MPYATPGSRRERREARERGRTRRTVYAVLGTVVLFALVGGVLLATGVVSFAGDDQKQAAGSVQVSSDTAARSTVSTTSTTGRFCRALSSTDPLLLWVGGDSLAGSLGPALGAITGETGVVQPYFDSRVSSGLANPGFFDWPDQATKEMARLKPEVVVFIIGTNDYTTPTADDAWKVDYAKRVEAMLTIFETASGDSGTRTIYWVGAPHLKDDNMDEGAAAVNEVAQGVLAKHKNAVYVDAHKLFSDTDGKYAQNLPDENGKLVTMRAGDGVHLTVDGGDFLARAVFKPLDAQCRITAQKVDGQTKQTIQTEGSTQVAPGSKSGGSVQTTPPYTSAPASTPPVTTATTTPATTTPTTPATTTPVTTTPTSVPQSPPAGG